MKNRMKIRILLALGVIFGLSGCMEDNDYPEPIDPKVQAAKDEKVIQDYFKANNITDTIADPSGIYIQHITEGTGSSPSVKSKVSVKYALHTLPEERLIEEAKEAVEFDLEGLILGWQIGIPYMKKGGEAYLYIPSNYAYRNGVVLRFKISLVDF